MKQVTSIHLCGLVLLATVLLVDSTPYQIHNLRRIRRAAEPEPEPASSSTPSSSSPSSSSSHDSHEVKCDGDISSYKKSCPNNDTCPMDDATVEKCCHCLSVCCGVEMGSSSEEKGKNNGSMKDDASAEPEPEPGKKEDKGKAAGDKVKDAMNSAEGWLKNTGQNIKSSFDKAAESAKHTANEMKDKVRQGINNVATKVKNATEDSKSDCKGGKDSKCTTDMDMSKSGDGEEDSSSMSGSTESSSGMSMNMSMNDTTPVPGHKKSKREAEPEALLSSSTSLETSYGSDGARDDSTEVTWTKSTTTKTKDSSRHRREQSSNNGGDVPSSTTQQSRNKRAAPEMSSTDMPSSTMSPNGGNGRNERDTTNMKSNENAMSGSTTENSSSNNGGTRRSKRASGTDNPDAGMVSSSTANPKGGRDRRAASSKGEATTMSPDSSSTSSPSSEDDTEEEADDDEDEEDTTESSTNTMKGKSSRPQKTNVSVSLRVNDTLAKRRVNSGNVYFPISPGGSMMIDSQYPHDESDYYVDGMDRPPTIVFPGAGVITAPGIGIKNIKKGNGGPDLSYYPPQSSASLSVESSLTGSFKGNHNHHQGTGSMSGSIFGGGSGSGQMGANMKPGYCQSMTVGTVNCISLQARSEVCNFDVECSGIKKCCFYNCDMYKRIGVCEIPTTTFTRTNANVGYRQ
ncbi:unnamed protein product [Orchesella dallaii]|uniref:WAP domain-containing protein n=1 Tax=Orchesella dallaii TaxID=48710 RepID=A0ABP1QRZ8_9HEXA